MAFQGPLSTVCSRTVEIMPWPVIKFSSKTRGPNKGQAAEMASFLVKRRKEGNEHLVSFQSSPLPSKIDIVLSTLLLFSC